MHVDLSFHLWVPRLYEHQQDHLGFLCASGGGSSKPHCVFIGERRKQRGKLGRSYFHD